MTIANPNENGRAVAFAEPDGDFERLIQKPLKVTPMERFISKKDDFWSIANAINKSGLAAHLRTPEAVFAVMLYGYRFGWDVWTSIQNCHIINGRVSQSAASMLAIAIENGATFVVKESGRKGNAGQVGEWCEFTLNRTGFESVTMTWTQADAKRAGLVKTDGNHQKYPSAMLRWRTVADACRLLFSDKLAGVRATEEIADQIAGVDGADPNWAEEQRVKKKNPHRDPEAAVSGGEVPAELAQLKDASESSASAPPSDGSASTKVPSSSKPAPSPTTAQASGLPIDPIATEANAFVSEHTTVEHLDWLRKMQDLDAKKYATALTMAQVPAIYENTPDIDIENVVFNLKYALLKA